MTHKCYAKPVLIKNRLFFLLCLLISMPVCGQFGIAFGPYFVTPNFGSVCYGQAHDKIGNNQSVGGMVHLNFGRRFSINASHLEFGGDRWGTGTPNQMGYGVGGRPKYEYLPLKGTEVNATWIFYQKELSGRMDFWGGEKLRKHFGLRAGAIQSQRMVQVKPTKVNYTVEDNGSSTQMYDYISWYDVTGLNQTIAFAGLEIDKYKSVDQYRNVFNRDQAQQRKRLYHQYIDLLFAVSSVYANYGVDSFSFSGASVKNINPFGWRLGLRRVTFNHIGHSFVCEFGQYPGQRRIQDVSSTGIDVDSNKWKNWFVFVGFHFSIGHWFGDYD